MDDRTQPPFATDRIVTLDTLRGVAVMGILAMNIVAFAMPFAAYLNPLAFGVESNADLASWAFSFVLIDGKLRGLFSFLFGASTLLVIQRAQASGRSPALAHYGRMFWLLVFGLLHFYFIWFGDILALYAQAGFLLFLFHRLSVGALIGWGVALVAVQCAVMAFFAGNALGLLFASSFTPAQAEEWRALGEWLGPLTGPPLAEKLALFRGGYEGLVGNRLIGQLLVPFTSTPPFLAETLGYMLFGMAALKSGFFRGSWDPARYRKWAIVCLGIALPAYALLAALLAAAAFSPAMVMVCVLAAPTPLRPLAVVGIAAVVILLTRRETALVRRIAAAGRAAFTNYLGTSLLMTTLFYGYGLGLYGTMSRIELWLPVFAMWALMLLWSKPWLERFRYGPFEWLWRSLARGRPEPMRRNSGDTNLNSN